MQLGNLTNLQELDLGSNSLDEGIPAELGNLTNLQELDLGHNSLTGEIPAELGNLTYLQELDIGYNSLTGGIPAELGNLTRLTELSLERKAVKHWSLRSVQVKLIKMGGRLVRHSRRLIFQLSEVSLPRWLFQGVLERPVPSEGRDSR